MLVTRPYRAGWCDMCRREEEDCFGCSDRNTAFCPVDAELIEMERDDMELDELDDYDSEKAQELEDAQNYIVGLETIIDMFKSRMNSINNIAVEWHENGPYDDANQMALNRMMVIEELSRLRGEKEESQDV